MCYILLYRYFEVVHRDYLLNLVKSHLLILALPTTMILEHFGSPL